MRYWLVLMLLSGFCITCQQIDRAIMQSPAYLANAFNSQDKKTNNAISRPDHLRPVVRDRDPNMEKGAGQVCFTEKFPSMQYQRDAQHTGYYPYAGPKKGKPKYKKSFKDLLSVGFRSGIPTMDSKGLLHFGALHTHITFDTKSKNIHKYDAPFDAPIRVMNDGIWPMMILDLQDRALYFHNSTIYRMAIQDFRHIKRSDDLHDGFAVWPVVDCDGTIYVVVKMRLCGSPIDEKEWCTDIIDPGFAIGGSVSADAIPAIGRDGEIYVPVNYEILAQRGNQQIRSALVKFNSDGAREWSNLFTGKIDIAPTVDLDGTVYIALNLDVDSDNALSICAQKETQTLWCYHDYYAGKIRTSPVIGPDRTLYFATAYGYIYAIDFNGNFLWKYCINKCVDRGYGVFRAPAHSAMLADKNGNIFFSAYNCLAAVDSGGAKLWQHCEKVMTTFDADIFSTPILGPDGTLYALYDGNLFAFSDK